MCGDNMKDGVKLVINIIELLIVIYVVFITSCILFKNRYGFTQFGDYTFVPIMNNKDTYIKDVKKGDLLIAKKVSGIKLNDTIYFYTSENGEYIVREGKITKVPVGDEDTLYDLSVEMLDKEVDTTVSGSKVVGNKAYLFPLLGSILTFLEDQTGFLLCVLLPIVLVFLYQIYEFISVFRQERKLGKNGEKTDTIEIVKVEEKKEDDKPIELIDEEKDDDIEVL